MVEPYKIYEKAGVKQDSNHPLGAVQSTIHGRVKFAFLGVFIIAVALLCLYILYKTNLANDFTENPFYKLAATAIFIAGIVWGVWNFRIASRCVKLRRTGFEAPSGFGVKEYAYKDVDFELQKTMGTYKAATGEGYVNNWRWVWFCWIRFNDGRKPIVLKSTQYARLDEKIQDLIDCLTEIKY